MRKTGELANAQANDRRLLEAVRVADIVKVTAFHKDKMTVDVKPIVRRNLSGTAIAPPPILGVKVAYVPHIVTTEVEVEGKRGTGKGIVTPDIKPGDIGAVVYLDLDSDVSIASGGESSPNSGRLHSGDDAVFVGVILPG